MGRRRGGGKKRWMKNLTRRYRRGMKKGRTEGRHDWKTRSPFSLARRILGICSLPRLRRWRGLSWPPICLLCPHFTARDEEPARVEAAAEEETPSRASRYWPESDRRPSPIRLSRSSITKTAPRHLVRLPRRPALPCRRLRLRRPRHPPPNSNKIGPSRNSSSR